MAYVPRKRRVRLPFKISRQKLVLYLIVGVIGMVIFGYIAALGLFAWYGRDLPQPGKLSESRGNSTIFYDRNGKIIYEMFKDKNRVPVNVDDISKYLMDATVAIEDKRFYQHKGISEYGIMRAAFNNLIGNPQGGSTITQQLIKNVLLTSERRLSRKIKEAILAYQVENKYTKKEILGMYLNEAPYGGTFSGVGSAAMGYFAKSPKDLTLIEAAILAGLPQNPPRFSPFIGEKDAWKGRTKDVLRRMREDSYITEAEEEKALAQIDKVKFQSARVNINAPHFIFYIKRQIEEQYGAALLNNGVKVMTTLDLELQQKAEKIVKDEIADLKDYKVGNGALVATDPTNGEIITYVGSYDYNDDSFGKFDVVSQANRQPGSTLKPIEYAAAFEKGYTPATIMMDVKTTFANQGDEDYIPVNYDGKYRGPVQVRFALGNSLNVPAVKMLAMIGIHDFMERAYTMGLDSMEPTQENMNKLGLSASLGGGETTLLHLAQAYGVFANGGKKVDLEGVLEISDFNGKNIFKKSKPKEKEVLSSEISFLISHILSDNNARFDTFGASSYLVIPGKTVAVKTGTTNDKRDNWAVGYTKNIVLGVWVGNNDNSAMNQKISSGATGASPIWHDVMVELLKKYKDGIIDKPEKVKAVEIDSYLGGLPKDGSPKRSEYFIEGTEPTEVSPYYKKLKLSKSNGKLANDVEAKSGNYEEKDFIVITENDPISTDGKNRWQEAIDAWAKEQGDSKFHYPTETSDSSSEDVIVSIKSPGNNQKVDSNDIEVKVKITSIAAIKESKIWINGEEKKVISGDSKDITEKFTLDEGVYEIKVQSWNEKGKSGDSSIKVGVKKDVN
ncbi:PBP1A family penicillin-binding protein [Candidatus Woesebacteria bacterium]|nr:PBP1A family penicillin-binding protein [Candidatus Woesebacteria bacterium]